MKPTLIRYVIALKQFYWWQIPVTSVFIPNSRLFVCKWRPSGNIEFGGLLSDKSKHKIEEYYTSEKPCADRGSIDSTIPTIVRFKLMKQAVKAFELASKRTYESWENKETLHFRKRLVAQLSKAQLEEFKLAFTLFDHDNNGQVESWELAKALSLFVRSYPFDSHATYAI